MDDPRSSTNIPEYTVTEISAAVKRTLEEAFNRVRVRGEITELKRYPSGHIYLSLKDETGKLSGVVWKNAISKLGLLPENGVEVIAQGRLSSYGERSSYQLIIEKMEYAGAGALLARVEMLRLRLAAEGLFDPTRKQLLPMLPQVIGVITSESGAVIQDIRTTISRRFPRRIILWPVAVQGPDAGAQIARAIAGFDAIQPGGAIPRPDILIVARGGGGLEDLMAFNEEVVLRAAAACKIPLISAVGHETDTTLIDFVSDRRAPTPTAAAEFAVPQRHELAANLMQQAARLGGAFNRISQDQNLSLQKAERGLPDLQNLIGAAQQKLDDRSIRLGLALRSFMRAGLNSITALCQTLPQPIGLVINARSALENRNLHLSLGLPNLLRSKRTSLLRGTMLIAEVERRKSAARTAFNLTSHALASSLRHSLLHYATAGARVMPRLNTILLPRKIRELVSYANVWSSRLESVSYQKVLERGFVLITSRSGKPLARAANVRSGTELMLHFHDGIINAKAGRDVDRAQLPLL